MKKILLGLLGIGSFFDQVNGQETPEKFVDPQKRIEEFGMKLTARVIDEEGKPMAGVPVLIRIYNLNDFQDQYNDFRDETNEEGKLTAEALGHGVVEIEVKHEGYYLSLKKPSFNEKPLEIIRAEKRYSPWNPVVDIMVKKVGNPIPLFVRIGDVKGAYSSAPVLGKKIEWDLLKADWLPPYGKGEQGDLAFTFQVDEADPDNPETMMSIEFPNPADGLIEIKELVGTESQLIFPREAPEGDYSLKVLRKSYKKLSNEEREVLKEDSQEKDPAGYFVRFRTEVDENGQVISALYGKVVESIELRGVGPRREKPSFSMDTYLNPNPNDRNLEFDQVSNLAPEGRKGVWLRP